MNAPLSVYLLDPHWHWARALIATLPRSLRLSDNVAGEGGLAVVDGTRAWPRDVSQLLSAGCRDVLVVEPGDAEPDAICALGDLAQGNGGRVTMSEGFAGNPAAGGFGAWLDDRFSTFTAQGTGAAGPSILLAQLRILRTFGVTEPEARSVLVSPDAFLAELGAWRMGAQLTLRLAGGVCESVPPRQVITAFAADATARIELYAGSEARPASAALVTHEGQQTLPTIYENAHRHALRMLVAAQGEPCSGQSAGDLRTFAGDIALARSICSSS